MKRVSLGLVVACAAVALTSCRTDIIKENPLDRPERGATIARVEMVGGLDCRGKANVAAIPQHCAWPVSAARDPIVSVDVQVVAEVDADDKVQGVRVLQAPKGAFDEAAIACASRARYRAPRDAEGVAMASETCPLTLRLARYVTDIEPKRDRPCPPAAETYGVARASGGPAAGDPTPLHCP